MMRLWDLIMMVGWVAAIPAWGWCWLQYYHSSPNDTSQDQQPQHEIEVTHIRITPSAAGAATRNKATTTTTTTTARAITKAWQRALVSPPLSVRKHDAIVVNDDDDHHHEDSPDGDATDDAATKVLNVHVVPHTHDDVGWRKTVEQYFYGWNSSIDTSGPVRNIISTAMESLLEHEARTFVYVEQKYFTMWWNDPENSPDAVRDSVRWLVANKQLSFVNGGWCMHDEAATHYMGMIDQTTLGHTFLLEHLGVIPTVGWQLDPFGHSATQASLLTARAGMDALYFGRIDYQDLRLRQLTQECEGLWKAAKAFNADDTANVDVEDDTIFWGLTGSYEGNYGAPAGFNFDARSWDEKLLDLNETRLMQRLHTFLGLLRIQSDRTKGNHIMLTMGTDFNYLHAQIYFANLDLLIGAITNYQKWGRLNIPAIFGSKYNRINIFYSTPEYYTKMKYQEIVRARKKKEKAREALEKTEHDSDQSHTNHLPLEATIEWKTKTDDFFPYSDGAHNFWTGYFTSRTALKRFERVASSFLMTARQIESALSSPAPPLRQSNCCKNGPLYQLDDALGVVQHHDGVSGTAKQHVADDYSKRLQAGVNVAARFVVKTLKSAMLKNPNVDLSNLMYCQLLNETTCDVSETATKSSNETTTLYVIVYNPVASEVSTVVRLPVGSAANFTIERLAASLDSVNHLATQQVVESIPAMLPLRRHHREKKNDDTTTKYVLFFDTGNLPPIGAATFRIAQMTGQNEIENGRSLREATVPAAAVQRTKSGSTVVTVSTDDMIVTFDQLTGMLQTVTADGRSLNLTQSWGYYTSFDSHFDHTDIDHDTATQNSGAYIFRPSTPEQELTLLKPTRGGATFVNTTVGVEVHVSFDQPWIKQATRVFKGQPFIEVEYTVGPIPIDDGRGKEIVTRYSSSIPSEGTFYTDSNGREFLERRRNFRPTWALDTYEPIAGNYYPVNAAIYIEDRTVADSPLSLSVLVDRSQGGSSLIDGSIELMVQRRTLADDSRGVDEPMNETSGGMTPYPPYGNVERIGDGVIIRGTHRIMVGTGGARLARSVMDQVFGQPSVFVGSAPSNQVVDFRQTSFSALNAALPKNVMLMTFAKVHNSSENTYLVRLGHQYSVNEDPTYSQPVQVDLTTLFKGFTVTKVSEKTLSGNQDWEEYRRRRFDWAGSKGRRQLDESEWSEKGSGASVTIGPMDIKTFHVLLAPAVPSF